MLKIILFGISWFVAWFMAFVLITNGFDTLYSRYYFSKLTPDEQKEIIDRIAKDNENQPRYHYPDTRK